MSVLIDIKSQSYKTMVAIILSQEQVTHFTLFMNLLMKYIRLIEGVLFQAGKILCVVIYR